MNVDEVALFNNVMSALLEEEKIPLVLQLMSEQITCWEDVPLQFATYPLVKACRELGMPIGQIQVIDNEWASIVKLCGTTGACEKELSNDEMARLDTRCRNGFGIDLGKFIKPVSTVKTLFGKPL